MKKFISGLLLSALVVSSSTLTTAASDTYEAVESDVSVIVNGAEIKDGKPSVSIDGEVYLPFSVLAEAAESLGIEFSWIDTLSQLHLKTPDKTSLIEGEAADKETFHNIRYSLIDGWTYNTTEDAVAITVGDPNFSSAVVSVLKPSEFSDGTPYGMPSMTNKEIFEFILRSTYDDIRNLVLTDVGDLPYTAVTAMYNTKSGLPFDNQGFSVFMVGEDSSVIIMSLISLSVDPGFYDQFEEFVTSIEILPFSE